MNEFPSNKIKFLALFLLLCFVGYLHSLFNRAKIAHSVDQIVIFKYADKISPTDFMKSVEKVCQGQGVYKIESPYGDYPEFDCGRIFVSQRDSVFHQDQKIFEVSVAARKGQKRAVLTQYCFERPNTPCEHGNVIKRIIATAKPLPDFSLEVESMVQKITDEIQSDSSK